MPFKGEWLNILVHPYHGLPLCNEKEQLLTVDTGSNLGKSHGHYAEWQKKKKPVTKGYMQYDSIYIAALKRQNDRNEEQSSSCQRLRPGVGLEGWVNVSIRG